MDELRPLHPHIWKACAGSSVQIPTVNSRVYYFPEGHAHHSLSPVDFSSLLSKKPLVLCRIISIKFLAHQETDEVFAKIRLEPIAPGVHSPAPAGSFSDEDDKILSFAKILTQSDANNGGGFSVPRFCADSIFPPLNYQADPPVQNISVRDVHGNVYEFRHIYRGTPRRHLLTTGWSKFVNKKMLVAGDSVVFMKNRSGELFVGIRRSERMSEVPDSGRWSYQIPVVVEEGFSVGEGFSRIGKGKVPAESVVEAAELAGAGRVFEIVYYPKAGSSDFVVSAEKVEEAMKVGWVSGMRVKMAVETEDSSRMTWFQGTVSSTVFQDLGPLGGSPWRMLQVTWDDVEALQNVKRVSPWQVELVLATPHFQNPYPPTKKIRLSQGPELTDGGEGTMFFPMAGLTNAMMEHLGPSMCNYNTFPAGMQGARHDPTYVSTLSNFIPNNQNCLYSDNIYMSNISPTLSCVSTELNNGHTLPSENSSPPSQDNFTLFGTKLFGHPNCNPMPKAVSSSFQLFGKTIQTKQTIEDGFNNNGHKGDGVSKGYNETESVVGPLDSSLASPYKQLCNQLDVQSQRVSALEAGSL
ncbi:auxin response factor 17-like [Tasmannia lanceolata]|uniref:auxin response factor 17-like n=1 Tax=Tasmannia lanceolata TaxID=3420 RepID=UPI004064C16F